MSLFFLKKGVNPTIVTVWLQYDPGQVFTEWIYMLVILDLLLLSGEFDLIWWSYGLVFVGEMLENQTTHYMKMLIGWDLSVSSWHTPSLSALCVPVNLFAKYCSTSHCLLYILYVVGQTPLMVWNPPSVWLYFPRLKLIALHDMFEGSVCLSCWPKFPWLTPWSIIFSSACFLELARATA